MIKKALAVGAFVAAVALGLTGMVMPPQGEIDPSVLVFTAQLLVLCATMLGLKLPEKPKPLG